MLFKAIYQMQKWLRIQNSNTPTPSKTLSKQKTFAIKTSSNDKNHQRSTNQRNVKPTKCCTNLKRLKAHNSIKDESEKRQMMSKELK